VTKFEGKIFFVGTERALPCLVTCRGQGRSHDFDPGGGG
jgi:hypothetical protein